jgi:hypothetical protein
LWKGALVLSALLHLLGLYLLQTFRPGELDTEVYRVRLTLPLPRFEPPLPIPAVAGGGPGETEGPVTQLRAPGGPDALPSGVAASLAPSVPRIIGPAAPMALREVGSGAKAERPVFERVGVLGGAELAQLPPVAELGIGPESRISSTDLLRLVDRSRANKDQAMVMIDPSSRRDLVGYINFARLRVYGAGSPDTSLDALARYLRDHTGILAQVQEERFDYFVSPALLKAPIHFLVQGAPGAAFPAYRDQVVAYFSPEERQLLGRYLRGGGFLYCEGTNLFLTQMAEVLEGILGRDGYLSAVPFGHEIYSAYYSFESGFPGEEGPRRPAEVRNEGWRYPTQRIGPQIEGSVPEGQVEYQFVTPTAEDKPRPLGLWGVIYRDQVVAVLSDLGIASAWAGSLRPLPGGAGDGGASLMMGANLVVYALTRGGGLTPKEARPVWMPGRPVASLPTGREQDPSVEGASLAAALDASLAVVQAPLGQALGEGGMELLLDGRYSVQVLNPGLHGVLLHNLPAGRHWIEVRYGGKARQVELDLTGGKVQTVTFAVSRLAFLTRLRLAAQEGQIGLEQWLRAFPDLKTEEMFLTEDKGVLEGNR